MRDYSVELKKRIAFIKEVLKNANASGIVYGNSGGKDSALVGILCKKACDNVLGVSMPCQSKRNYEEDMSDAKKVAMQFGIDLITVDLTDVKETFTKELSKVSELSGMAAANINPRLRMIALYALAQSKNSIVSGTGNASEGYMGYFTKFGDGAYDFNPIADLTVTEIYEFLSFLGAPQCIIDKAPSAGLFEGQTDEKEMGITYKEIDDYLLYNKVTDTAFKIIDTAHKRTEHKRKQPMIYEE